MTFIELCSTIDGPVIQRNEPGFTEELQGYNLAVKHNPELVVGASSITDIQTAVRYASKHGIQVTVLATGHGSQQAMDGGMAITVKRLNSIAIHEPTRTATVGGGVLAGDVASAAAPFGLAPVAGGASGVGLTGLILGGGLGPLARSHGFCSDFVTKFRVVLSDGEEVSADKENNAELFWALRGGKGGFGIVVEMQVRLISLRTFYGGSVAFAENDIDAVLRGWVNWTHRAPKIVTTSVAIMRFPSSPGMSESIRGKTLLMLRFAYPGGVETGRILAEPLLSIAEPVFGELAELPGSRLDLVHKDPTVPTVCWADGTLLNNIDGTFVTDFLEQVGQGRQSPFLMVELRHLGGASQIDVPGGSAVGGRSGEYSLYLVGKPDSRLFETALPKAFDQLLKGVDSYLCSENFINWWSGRKVDGFERCWAPSTYARLKRLRNDWDPKGVFAILSSAD